jgi:folate-binding protein YgfZ
MKKTHDDAVPDRIRSMSLSEDYQAIRQGAVLGSISPRIQLAVAGNDRAAYLQGLLTNDIQALTAGTGCYSAWLSPQGRMLTDMHVLESGGMILLDVPSQTAMATVERLEQFIFSEDVRVGSMADSLAGVWIHGPEAAGALERTLEGASALAEWPAYRHSQFEIAGQPVSVARIDQLGVPGYCVYLDRSRESALVAALQGNGARAVGGDALEAARIEAGYPVFGVDMTEATIPLEAGIEQRAISFTKGCYVGQEIIIRVLHRGGGRVARKLVALGIDGAVPARGARLLADDREIGEVTSAAESPRHGPIALGYVHRDFTAPGTSIHVQIDSGRAPAVVAAR